VAVGLIFVEPDRGTTILLGCVCGAMLFDFRRFASKHLVLPAMLGVLFLGFSILHDPVRRERILAWVHPDQHKMDAGLQADHAMLALGSGGWTGLGLGNSPAEAGLPAISQTRISSFRSSARSLAW